jgi:RimJ/RimL family protein N-acetyltransferase
MEIETERLRLVSTRLEDAENAFEAFTEKVTARMFPKPSKSIEETEEWIRSAIKKNEGGEQWQFTIFNKSGGAFVGMGGIHNIDTDTPELGIWLAERAWGNDYGKEAMAATVRWANENLGFKYVRYPVDKDNLPSRKVAEFLGGVIEGEYREPNARGEMMDLVEYRIYPGRGE